MKRLILYFPFADLFAYLFFSRLFARSFFSRLFAYSYCGEWVCHFPVRSFEYLPVSRPASIAPRQRRAPIAANAAHPLQDDRRQRPHCPPLADRLQPPPLGPRYRARCRRPLPPDIPGLTLRESRTGVESFPAKME